MSPSRALSAALLTGLLSAPCAAGDGDLPQPQSKCSQGPGQCYSPPELDNVAGVISKKDDDVPIVKAVLNNPYPPGADVRYPDVQSVAGYFGNEQGIREGVEQALIKYGHYPPDKAQEMINTGEAKAAMHGLIKSGQIPKSYLKENIKPYWVGGHESMQQIITAKGPFVMALNNTKNDPLVPLMMKPLGQGQGAEPLPPITTPSQLQQSQPNNPEAYVDGAQAAAADGDLRGAVNQASQALSLDPNNQQALDIRGAAQYQLGDKDAARADAQKALKLNPNDQTASAILNLGGNVDGSAQVKSPADPFGANPAGIGGLPGGVASNASFNDRGAASLKATASTPQGALLRDAVGALSVGDSAAAERTLDKIIALDPNNAAALNMRALALARQRRYAEALRDADSVLARDPKNGTAMNIRSVALNKLKRFSDAVAQARAAIELNPNDGAAYRNLAEALAGMGDRAGSLAALKKAAELDARYTGTLEAALQLPADADLNLLFADDAPSSAAVDAARAANAARRPWNARLVGTTALGGFALLLIGLWSQLGSSLERWWHRITREKVVRASEARYLVEPERPIESKSGDS